MQLAPHSPLLGAVFSDLPLALSYGDFWCMGDIEKVAYPAD
jgi:hypothetical protein